MGTPLRELNLFGRAESPLTIRRPLIPFLKEPWNSKSSYPALILETFLYGIYVVLFLSSAFFIVRSKIVQRKLLMATSLLFLLGTADILLTLYFFFYFVLQPKAPSTKKITTPSLHEHWIRLLEVKFALYVVANFIASGLLINRCYTLWKNRRIVIAPVTMLVVGTIISFVSISASQLGDKLLAASFITSAAANLSVTFLIASKVLWTSTKIKGATKMNVSMIFDHILSLLLDSGAFYSLSIFLYLLLHTLVIDASLTQIAGVTISAMVLRNSQTCEPLAGMENTAFHPTTTQPDMGPVVVPCPPSSPIRARSSFTVLESRMSRDSVSIDSEYK